jgi:hypothetical protein
MRYLLLILSMTSAALLADVRTDAKTEPAKTEPAKTEPAKTEPTKTEPAKAEPAKTEPAKTEPAKTEAVVTVSPGPGEATACLEITARVHTSAHPYSAPSVETRRVRGLKLGRAVLTDIDHVRGMTAGQIVAGDARENLRLVYAGYDTGLALLFPEKDAVAAVTIENTIRLSLDSDLSVYSCQGPAQESRRFRVSRIAPRRLDNNENGVFETAEVDGAVQVALSGSPVYAEGRFAGILHKGQSAYVLPASVVLRFLEDVKDGRYDGLPVPGFLYQPLTHPELRKYLGIPDSLSGVRITRAEPGSLLLAGDYLTSIAGAAVSSDGRINGMSIEDAVRGRQAGNVEATIVRGGRTLTIQLPLRPAPDAKARARSIDGQRRYFLTAGLVFQELDLDLLLDTPAGRRPGLVHRFRARLLDQLALESDQDLILTEVLADPANAGADRFLYTPVESVNGSVVRNMRDLRSLFQSLSTKYVVIRFRNRAGAIVLERDRILESNKRIAERYSLPESVFEEVLP